MLTERTLKKWRKEALQIAAATDVSAQDFHKPVATNRATILGWQKHILQMTQELLDQHLLRRRKR